MAIAVEWTPQGIVLGARPERKKDVLSTYVVVLTQSRHSPPDTGHEYRSADPVAPVRCRSGVHVRAGVEQRLFFRV